ncbi:unnamed protein product [Prorocentrum cordatum]|uniref:Uncharacterized protein n=1 Tax=Prorocentrum cordatum TaxID=2364126 RepID=A0ABN9W7B7_9DINO|nr:unnamed protein product [Polarella glacialis]
MALSPSLFQKVLDEVRSGLLSSVVAEAALFPLDTVKLLQQVHGGSALEVARGVLHERGPIGLYRGLIGRLIQTVTSNVGFFIWQTIFVQAALSRVQSVAGDRRQLGTGLSLLVNMFAQQFNRVLTTPVDVVANVNQADPNSRGFFHTFVRLARTGGRATLWRGLNLALLLSLNPALMFTLVGKLSALVLRVRDEESLAASDMFWVSGISKAVATLVTYPLISGAVAQTMGSDGVMASLRGIVKKDGAIGLYQGVWLLSYKTILFNSMMMALKQKFGAILDRPVDKRAPLSRKLTWRKLEENELRQRTQLVQADAFPWDHEGSVVYVDGAWSFLHDAQQHFLREASSRGDYLLVGVHGDQCLRDVMGAYPSECFAERMDRLKKHPLVGAVLEAAPWEVTEDLVRELGVQKVLAGAPISKVQDCRGPGDEDAPAADDPYRHCRRLGIFEEVESLNQATEHDVWLRRMQRIVFSNVDASIDWRILVRDGAQGAFGANPGYAGGSAPEGRGRSKSRPRSASRPRSGRGAGA